MSMGGKSVEYNDSLIGKSMSHYTQRININAKEGRNLWISTSHYQMEERTPPQKLALKDRRAQWN